MGSEVVVVGTGLWMKEMGVTLASDTDQRAAKVHTSTDREREAWATQDMVWCVM